jgi:hypothetical protein
MKKGVKKMNRRKVKIVEINEKGAKKVEFVDYNRPINTSLVNKLKESMSKYGVLSTLTVYDAGDKHILVDGQHRWTAAKSLGLSMPAIVIDWDAMSAIVEMNTIQKNWTMENFVDFYCAHADPQIKRSYSFLKRKRQEHNDLTYSSLAKIYGKPYGGPAFKEGKWRVTNEQEGDKFVGYLNDIEDYLPYAKSARFIYAYTDVAYHPDYDHNRMMKKFGMNHGVSLITSSNPKNYGVMLTKIYNYRQPSNLVMFKGSWI